ncbi:golgin subfamily A member 4 isoform X2, partial [Brachionus plicatilis]
LKKELDTSQSEVNNLKSENDTLSKELVHRDKRIEELIEKINQSELSLNDLGKKIQEKNTEMESMKKSMLEKEQNILNENQMLKTNIDQLNDQYKQSIELIENLKKEKTELEKRTSEKLSENEKLSSAEIERLKKELNRIESEKLTAERTVEALEKEKRHFDDSKLEMERLIDVKDGQLDNLNFQIKSEEENKIFLTKKVSDLEVKMSESLRENEKFHIKEIENLREEISRISSEKILADEEIEGLNKRISLLNDEIAARTIQIEELQQNEKNLIHRFQVKESLMVSQKDQEIEEFKRECNEKLKNSQIDIDSLQERLDQANKDYRASIEKIQQTRKQHLAKIKKKLQHCASILSLMDKLLFQSNETDQTVLTLFLSSLTEPKKNDESQEEKSNFEFDEAKFRELIEYKKNHLEKLDQLENLNQEIKKLGEINQNLQQEIVLVKSSSTENETKLSNEKIKISNDFQQKIDELQLKIDNLDLKNKQLQSEENRESHNLKTKILDLENELSQVRKHNDELVNQLKSDVESKEKNLMNVKKQADLRMASIKKKFENESQSKLEEINAKNYDLELKIKEKNKLIEMFKTENDNNVIKMNQLEEELEKKFVSEKLILQEDFGNKVKNYESIIEELNLRKEDYEAQMTNDKNNLVSSLRNENSQLSRKLDDLQFAYDELLDEKNNLKFNLNELKENGPSDNQEANRLNSLLKDRERVINELEQKLSLYVNKSAYEDSLGYVSSQNLKQNNTRSLMMESSDQDSLGSKTNLYNHCLESTEIDYLRQIVYSYMMGIDPVTMAKVIVAVLKFSEEDRKKILENERQRHLNWFPNLVNK